MRTCETPCARLVTFNSSRTRAEPVLSRARKNRAFACLALAISAANFLSYPFREHPIVTDIRYFLYFATRTAHGAVPHVDLFDNKTSLATIAGALLVRAGESAGVDPLYAVRIGYLGFAALAGVLLFAIHRRLRDDSNAAGFIALGCYLGFSLLGLLPAIGNVPKMLMAVFASLMGLSVHRRWWRLAGAAAALAFMDWQVGALAVLAALLGAAVERPGERGRAVANVVIGAAAALAPFVVWYLWKGALAAAWREVIEISFARGAGSWEGAGPVADWPRRVEVIESGCPGHLWLVVVGIVGMPIYLAWLRRIWGREPQRLAVAMGFYHYGVIAFSLLDFQFFGDLFLLLHSVAFFAAVAANELHHRICALPLPMRGTRIGGTFAKVVALLLAALLARAWVPRGSLRLPAAHFDPRVTLADQRAVAARLLADFGGATALFLGPAEQLFLTGMTNSLPIVYWNGAAYVYFRRSPEENRVATLQRLIESTDSEIVVCDRGAPLQSQLPSSFAYEKTEATEQGYGVDLFRRRLTGREHPVQR